VRVLGISGSLRRASYNTALLRAAGMALLDDVDFEIYARLKEIPPYDPDDDHDPAVATVAHLRSAIAKADAVIFATPEYNSSVPGVLKNAVDWAARPLATNVLRNKPVTVVGVSTGMFGAVWAQAELRKVLAACGARVLAEELPVGLAETKFDASGRLVDGDTARRLVEVVYGLVDELVPVALVA
jgi:chromate reductase